MSDEAVNRGFWPYCGVYVQFYNEGIIVISEQHTAVGLRCPSCAGGVVALVEKGQSWRRYPPNEPADIEGVPPAVMQAYREAILALDARAPRASACMLRRT